MEITSPLNVVESVMFGLLVASAAGPLIRFLDRANERWLGGMRTRLEELGIQMPYFNVAMRWWWVAVVAVWVLLAYGLNMKPIAAVLAIFLVSLPGTALSYAAEVRRIRLRDQMVIACRVLASQLTAGPNITNGLREVVPGLSMPIKAEFQRMSEEHFRHGFTVQEVLTGFRDRMKIDAVSLFCNVMVACYQNGGDASVVVRKISESLEQLQRVELKKNTYTAAGRMQVGILAVFPLLFMGMMHLMDPKSVQLMLHSYYGQLALAVVMIMTYIAVRWTMKILEAID